MAKLNCICDAYPFPHRFDGGKCQHKIRAVTLKTRGYCLASKCRYAEITRDPYATGDFHLYLVECAVMDMRDCPLGDRIVLDKDINE